MTHPAYTLTGPAQQLTAAIFASPHSGRSYPAAFLRQSVLDARALRSSEDAFVDQLFDAAPDHGAMLLCASMPRAYLDLNRAADELDPGVIEGVVRAPHNPRIAAGLGVIPRVVAGGRAIYRGKLALAEAEARLAKVWRPYHAALEGLITTTQAQFGEAILLDCHSMPHEAIEGHTRPGQPAPEVVLGDRFGAAASAEVMEAVEAAFVRAGLRVARNTPFAGAHVAQAYGRPSRGQHVIQIEIDRALYMDEARLAPHGGFESLRWSLRGVIAEICAFGQRGARMAAE